MRLAGLHALGRDRPARGDEVDFLPGGVDELRLADSGQQDESHSRAQRRCRRHMLQGRQDRADFGRGQSAVARLERGDGAGADGLGRVFHVQPTTLRVAEHQQHHLAHVHGDSRPALLLHLSQSRLRRCGVTSPSLSFDSS